MDGLMDESRKGWITGWKKRRMDAWMDTKNKRREAEDKIAMMTT